MIKKLYIIMLPIIISKGCDNLNPIENETTYKRITPENAKEIIDNEDVIILDVRTTEEYADDGHIENSVLLPVSEIEEKASKILVDKNAKILIYCQNGTRSALAAIELIDMGYLNVYDFGAITSWPYDVVK